MIGKQSLLPTAALAESQWAEAMSSTKLIAPESFFLLRFREVIFPRVSFSSSSLFPRY